MQQQKRLILFMFVALAIMVLWTMLQHWLQPPKPEPPEKSQPAAEKPEEKPKPPLTFPLTAEGKLSVDLAAAPDANFFERMVLAVLRDKGTEPVVKAPTPDKPAESKPRTPQQPIMLGKGPGRGAAYNLFVELDPDSAGVKRLVLNKFQQADRDGKPEFEENGAQTPLQLFPQNNEDSQRTFYRLQYRTQTTDGKQDEKYVELPIWEKVEPSYTKEEEARATFQTKTSDFIITKTYTLKPGDYHIGLEIKVQPANEAAAKKSFQYQLSSPYNLRVEGEWYTSTFRNAVMCKTVGNGYAQRVLTDGREITKAGGTDASWKDKWVNGKEDHIHFFGIAVQFFASVVAVDVDPEKVSPDDVLEKTTPIIEQGQVRAIVEEKSIDEKLTEFRLKYKESHWIKPDTKTPIDATFHVAKDNDAVKSELEKIKKRLDQKQTDDTVVVRYRRIGDKDFQVTSILNEKEAAGIYLDDVSVQAVSKPINNWENGAVTHSYKLYNGPVKVRLLKELGGTKEEIAARSKLVDEVYLKKLHLDKLTDAPSTSWISEHIFYPLGFTWLLVQSTNVMHEILYWLHWLVEIVLPYQWTWGLCILFLTMMVRGAMFPVSRKQAMMSIRMQQLAPELKKLQEKHKGDRQAMGAAQMELYRKHGVNPFGSCWLIFLQMPIFLGLYYALGESIHFRLAPFLWIKNLAAPDMLFGPFGWLESLPLIGGYLGPFVNLLPMIAVAFMIAQQSMLTPPPADEQQAMQMKMMKYMMVIFGFMFYKVAAGLCIYFIASSIWGFTERKLLPKRKLVPGAAPPPPEQPGLLGKLVARLKPSAGPNQGTVASTYTTPATNSPEARSQSRRKQRRSRNKQGRGGPAGGQDNGETSKVKGWWSGLREWWAEVLKQAQKK